MFCEFAPRSAAGTCLTFQVTNPAPRSGYAPGLTGPGAVDWYGAVGEAVLAAFDVVHAPPRTPATARIRMKGTCPRRSSCPWSDGAGNACWALCGRC